jgi:hypothetical protein
VSSLLRRLCRPRSGIYVVNSSTLVTDADVKAWTAACSFQLARDVAPAFDRKPVRVEFLTKASHAPAGAWIIAVLDDADQAGALGYHTTDRAGRPWGRIFVRPCLDYGVEPSTTLSHEVIETFGDPEVDAWRDSGAGYSVAYELCDPVEAGSYQIGAGGVLVSDFVFPAWFHKAAGPGSRFNYLRTVHLPFALDAGGYVVRRFPDGTEDQEYGREARRDYIAAKRHALARSTRRLGLS